MRKQMSAEKKARKVNKPRAQAAPELNLTRLNEAVSGDQDYKEILLEINKELRELRSILEG